MGQCDTCGNYYDKTLSIDYAGTRHNFDCFECAIEKLAPHCGDCGCRVIGHGVERDGKIFCCNHCAEHQGASSMSGRQG